MRPSRDALLTYFFKIDEYLRFQKISAHITCFMRPRMFVYPKPVHGKKCVDKIRTGVQKLD